MKISVVGAGQVGGQAAFLITSAGLGDVVLLDVKTGLAKGKALDIGQSLAVVAGRTGIIGTEEWASTAGSDVLVVTAGLARRPGMSRHDLLMANAAIVPQAIQEALRWSPDAVVVVVTNPINTMAYLANRLSGLAPERVIGMAGMLDNARFRYFIANELGVPLEHISSWVMGDHGDFLVPVASQTRVAGERLTHVATPEQLKRIRARTRNAGTEILNHLREGSAFFAPGAAICRMVSAILCEEAAPLPCSVYLQGEYGAADIMVGVPAVLGRKGVREIIEFDLDPAEQRELAAAITHIRQSNRQAQQILT